jgi:methionyl-tRNA formyltransferase
MIRIYTKTRHIEKIEKFLKSINITYEIYTTTTTVRKSNTFDFGVSYCYPKKISEELLNIPKKGFVNYHPGPLPKYKGPSEYENAVKNKETHWGVTVHRMDKNFDSGEIVKVKNIELHEPPRSIEELGAISHYFLFELFKETIEKIYED